MPIYEYVCRNCGHELEQLQRMSDDPLTVCPTCGEPQLKRKISAAGFRLSGGGWYETDFKSDGKRNLAGGDDKPASTSGDTKADTKKDGGGDKTDKSSASDKPSPKTDKPKDSKPANSERKKPASGTSD